MESLKWQNTLPGSILTFATKLPILRWYQNQYDSLKQLFNQVLHDISSIRKFSDICIVQYKYVFLIRVSYVDKRVCMSTVKAISLQLHMTSGSERTPLSVCCQMTPKLNTLLQQRSRFFSKQLCP